MIIGLYRLSLFCYSVLIRLASPFNRKASLFVSGRKGVFKELSAINKKGSKLVWVHAASLGEFEQGRPIIEELRQSLKNTKILLTFFSPSGYEIRKNYEWADWVTYLPLDSPSRAQRFVDLVRPDLAIFIKYEFWYFYLKVLHESQVPVLLASSIFRGNQLFFHPMGRFFLKVFRPINHFFVQDEGSKSLLNSVSIDQVTVAGDTRFDRVMEIAKRAQSIPLVDEFVQKERIIILGSSWPSDMEILESFIEDNIQRFKFVIAPHNLGKSEIQELLKLPHAVKFSAPKDLTKARVLIIDNMGMLSAIYRYAHIAYVGGGFRGALHNILEAAVYGIPVIWGWHQANAKFIEATGLAESGGGFVMDSRKHLDNIVDSFEDDRQYEKACQSARNFVIEKTGATGKIVEKVRSLL